MQLSQSGSLIIKAGVLYVGALAIELEIETPRNFSSTLSEFTLRTKVGGGGPESARRVVFE